MFAAFTCCRTPGFCSCFRALLAGQDFEDFDPNQHRASPDAQTPERLVAAFTRTRQDSLALLKQTRDEDLQRTMQHSWFGTVILAEMLHMWATHDLMHAVQADRALMHPFLLGSGPWRTFFRDHKIAVPDEEG